MKTVFVTTSWDDGHILDRKLAALLKKHGIKATFYVSPKDREFATEDLLTDNDIRELAKGFEIGAHTVTHPHLATVDRRTMVTEITGSKTALEKILRKPVRSFCYPYGSYNDTTKQVVREAGFTFARTVGGFQTVVKDRFAADTSVHVYDHRRDGMRSVIRRAGWQLWRVPRLARWDNLGKQLFAEARDNGGVFHLWGHSHEIEALGHWERLEAFLIWLKAQPNVRFITNGEIPIVAPKAIITAPYFKPHSGGLEEYAYQISKGLHSAHGWNVLVVTSGGLDETEHDSYQGLSVRRLPYRLRLSNTPFGFGWRRALKRLIAEEQPDVIVSHAPVPGMIDVTASVVAKIPFVITYHMGTMRKGRALPDLLINAYETLVLPRTLRKASLIVSASAFVERTFLTRYASKSVVITPGVDANAFKPASGGVTARTLMQIGGLKTGEEHKGLETSIRVIAKLIARYPDVRLNVVGNGDRQPYFEALAQQLGVAGHVTFRGRLTGSELITAYQGASVLLVPSHRESFGMAIVEAMACGVPVVASDVEGIPEVVRDGKTGMLVPPGDVERFVTAVSKLLDNAILAARMSAAARRIAVSSYQWDERIAHTDALLLSVAGLPGPDQPKAKQRSRP